MQDLTASIIRAQGSLSIWWLVGVLAAAVLPSYEQSEKRLQRLAQVPCRELQFNGVVDCWRGEGRVRAAVDVLKGSYSLPMLVDKS